MEHSMEKTGIHPLRSLYLTLASLRTSVYLLGLLSVLYVLGTVFPQGAEIDAYEEAGGMLPGVVRFFDLLNIFDSIWFLLPSAIFFLSLTFCAYERFLRIRSRRWVHPDSYSPDYSIGLSLGPLDAEDTILRDFPDELGLKRISSGGGGSSTQWTTFEKGLYYRWLTWLYHAAIAACFVGFLISGLFMIEGIIKLTPGEPVEITSIMDEELGWLVSEDHARPGFKLALDEFRTEYSEFPELKYPKDKHSRLAIALGWKPLTYDMTDDSLFPKDWFSKLRVVRGKETVMEKTIEVNHPLKYSGYTFYQLGYTQDLTLSVEGEDEPVVIRASRGHTLPGTETELRFNSLRTGTLYRLDGTKEELTPFILFKKTPIKENDPIKLTLGADVEVDGKRVTFTGFEEASLLSYRYDPGVPILWFFGSIVFVVMALRCFGGWYLVAVRIEDAPYGSILHLHIRSKGLIADPDRLVRRVTHGLGTHTSGRQIPSTQRPG